jgi:16S rRNA (guanine(527)-N(7))-methyltransferase RsmG
LVTRAGNGPGNLFHVKPDDVWRRCAQWGGIELDSDQIGLLVRYRRWLTEEASPAGALGPAEGDRIERRHIGDSLLFARCLPDSGEVVDLGSGAGLPGIPLAVALPDLDLVLVDRSGRRADLLRRVTRILDLPNVQVTHGDITAVPGLARAIVSRATMSPDDAEKLLLPRVQPGGVVVLGGSWVSPPSSPGWDTVEVPASILDQQVWLLMMRAK